MKLRMILITGVLMTAISASSVFASEAMTEEPQEAAESSGGLLQSLFGDGGVLADVLPEGTDIDAIVDSVDVDGIVNTISEQLDQADSDLSAIVDNVIEKVQSEAGDLNPDALTEYTEGLLGMLAGVFGENDSDDLEELFRIHSDLREQEKMIILNRNAELMDPGDVQLVTISFIHEDDYSLDEIRVLSCIDQNNFSIDEENQMWLTGASQDVILFTHQKDENGNYPVKDASYAEDGENFGPSIEPFCEEVGADFDQCIETTELNKAMAVYDMKTYLDEHPDIKGIEYQGELRTSEELEEIWSGMLNDLYPEPETEDMTEAGPME